MAKKYLDSEGLLYLWQKIKTVFVPQTRKINNKTLDADITLTASDVSALPSSTTIPSAGTGSSYPVMDGTRSLGSQAGFARVDHVHPSDTSRVPTTRTVNGKALSADVTLSASDVGALPDDTAIPTKTSDLTNDSNFVSDASYVHTDNNYTSDEKTLVTQWSNFKSATIDGVRLSGSTGGILSNVRHFAECSTAASDYTKKVTIPQFRFVEGAIVWVKFKNKNTAAASKLQLEVVGATTESGRIQYHGADLPSATMLGKNYIYGFICTWDDDQIVFELMGDINTDTKYGSGTQAYLEAGTSTTDYLWTPKILHDYVGSVLPSEVTTTVAGLMSAADKIKLNGIATGAEVNVQADWNETDTASDAFIKNKPDLSTKADLASPALTGTPTAPTAPAGTNNTQIATTAFVKYAVSTAVTGAIAYQGTVSGTFAPALYTAGWYWIVSTAGTYVGQVCEPGDMIFCRRSDSVYDAANFDVVQTNLDITQITNAEIDTIVAS